MANIINSRFLTKTTKKQLIYYYYYIIRTSMVKQDSTGAIMNWNQVIRDPRLWTPQNVQALQQIYTKHNPGMRCGNIDFLSQDAVPVCIHIY